MVDDDEPPPQPPASAPGPATGAEVTLAQALSMHLRAMRAKRCAPRSMETLEEECRRHLGDWLGRPLAGIRRNECALRHDELSERCGPYVANRVLAQLRAVYNTAARRFEELPPVAPVVAVTFNRVRRRRQPIPWDELPAWRAAVESIGNPIRRDLQLFLLLTGLRSLDARTIRWEHVDLEARTLHRPEPKGGAERAFTIPLSREAAAVLERRRAGNAELYPRDGGWAFPAHRRDGTVTHVREPKEQRDRGGAKRTWLPSPHRLRDTFASAAHEAGVHPLDLKVLLNHALPAADDVTQGYIRPSPEHLRGCAETIAAFLRERMGSSA